MISVTCSENMSKQLKRTKASHSVTQSRPVDAGSGSRDQNPVIISLLFASIQSKRQMKLIHGGIVSSRRRGIIPEVVDKGSKIGGWRFREQRLLLPIASNVIVLHFDRHFNAR